VVTESGSSDVNENLLKQLSDKQEYLLDAIKGKLDIYVGTTPPNVSKFSLSEDTEDDTLYKGIVGSDGVTWVEV